MSRAHLPCRHAGLYDATSSFDNLTVFASAACDSRRRFCDRLREYVEDSFDADSFRCGQRGHMVMAPVSITKGMQHTSREQSPEPDNNS